MSLILNKYIKKKKLGKGSFGDVILAEDSNAKLVAIKMVPKKMVQNQPHLLEYIKGQKEVMMDIRSPNVVELYEFQEDQNFFYFVCQYCDGGDLLNYQAKQTNKVFTLDEATYILYQIIKGFETLHERGYLHRDIKPANILLKKTSQNKYDFKLGDFGLSKKYTEVSGTVVGTQSYLSPQILKNQVYSFEVDMWAFGVLFYLMLNMQLPFKFNLYDTIQIKRQKLIKQATDFSYTSYVKSSKKKIHVNCTPQVQDLFKKIFNPNRQKRITFIQIRQHPLFKKYFPYIDKSIISIYDHNLSKQKTQKKKSFISGQNGYHVASEFMMENAVPGIDIQKVKTTREKQRLQAQFEKINFLYQVNKQLPSEINFVNPEQFTFFNYNILKYYVILLRNFLGSITPQRLQINHPNYKWKQYSKTAEFNSFKNTVQQKLREGEFNFSLYSDQCNLLNSSFSTSIQNMETQLIGNFKTSYRNSTGNMYEAVRSKFSNGNKFAYLTALIVMCHGFNHLIECGDEDLQKLFPQFFAQRQNKQKYVQFVEIKNWLSRANKQKIKNSIKNIISNFFAN